jgi:hypothetical protein
VEFKPLLIATLSRFLYSGERLTIQGSITLLFHAKARRKRYASEAGPCAVEVQCELKTESLLKVAAHGLSTHLNLLLPRSL